jgi:hypothetical protein
MAERIERFYTGVPVYTTWPYGIGEALQFYMGGGRKVEVLPETPPAGREALPERVIVLYRPWMAKEKAAYEGWLRGYEAGEVQAFAGRGSKASTTMVVLTARAERR